MGDKIPPLLYIEQSGLEETVSRRERKIELYEEELTGPDWEEHEAELRNFW